MKVKPEKPVLSSSVPGKRKRRSSRNKLTFLLLKIVVVLLAAVLVAAGIGRYRAGRSGDTIVVALDAAHDGDSYGAKGVIDESVFTDELVNAIEAELKKDSRFTVIRTHRSKQEAGVKRRVETINAAAPDILISVACQSSMEDAAKKGTTIYADVPTQKTNAESLKFAAAMRECFSEIGIEAPIAYYYYKPIGGTVFQPHIVDALDQTDYKEDTFTILQETKCPAVVIRQIDVTNQTDVETWANPSGYKKLAEAYAAALKRMYKTD